MRFEEAYDGWRSRRLLQEEAAQLLGVCERTFRRYIDRFEEAGLEGLIDKRIDQVSSLRAPVDEVLALEALYRERYDSWNVQHFFERYRSEHQGERGYTWVKQRLQSAKLVTRGKRKGTHRKRRERVPLEGMMIHQDGSTHCWVPEQVWDLIVTMDDATSEVYSALFVEEEGTWSSLRGVRETLEKRGLFSSFYSDRHYWHTPKAGGAVDRSTPTQFGRAMGQLGITMIAAYSPQARGRSERMFKTLQDRLPKELALHGVTTMEAANRFLVKRFLPAFNRRFAVVAAEEGSAFVPMLGVNLDEILCIKTERTVGSDNCVSYRGKVLQVPKVRGRCHFAKSVVMVHEYADGGLAVYHGPRALSRYEASGAPRAKAAEQRLDDAA
jgi:transposase